MFNLNLSDCAQFLKEHDNFLILTHKNPDGDTAGCAAALCLGLRKLGKTAYVLDNPGFIPKLRALVGGMCSSDFVPECVVAVDIADSALLPENAKAYQGNISLAVDHHRTHKAFASNLLLSPESAACGEIIYSLIGEMGVEITKEIATALYIAISTDTGCFLHSNTTPVTHTMAASLLSLGVDFNPIHRDFFITKSAVRLQIEAELVRTMLLKYNGRLALMLLPLSLVESTCATEDDLDNISALTRTISGVELGVLIREMPNGTCKISMRSSQNVNAAEVCARFDGGGHYCAAGCTMSGNADSVKELLLSIIDEMQIFS